MLAKVYSLSILFIYQLQIDDMDMSTSMELADNITSAVDLLRIYTEEEFKTIYTDGGKKCESLKFTISIS